jgi:hypothetical protein
MKKKSPKWFPQVHFHDGRYIAYAIHTNGKVEREGSYPEKIDAILNASDLSNMLNLYHRYAGKYAGTDKLFGGKIPQKDIDDQLERSKLAWQGYQKAMRKLKMGVKT